MATLFTKIINREIPAEIVYESDTVIAIKDINPQAPAHILIIPKKEINNIVESQPEDQNLLGECLLTAKLVGEQLGIAENGYRLVINNGSDGGQEVPHLHIHLLAGRKLTWPPG